MKVGSFPAFLGKVAAHRHTLFIPGRDPIFLVEDVGTEIPSAEEQEALMRTPLVPKVSLRCMAAKMDSRVFCSAHTPPSPAVLSRPVLRPASFFPLRRISGVASSKPCPPK